ncbi:MAG: DNA polymerase III subunit alpha [Lutibacter sp.]|uniref:DNA polymerase III subunit alpha n=1 Tax=Lutibacter sp. TaxID=1925666 RepID=UPI0019DCBD24|nr:DNA polymerase III subunit alpha [Lutibacter sp.]NOR27667.1 DNA polymerase III subunit alpha [Lutibacter sp.]
MQKQENKIDIEEYKKRFKHEFSVIKDKGFVKYFLIVFDSIEYCKKNGIMTGARGSAAGSLVSYLLGIIDIDPIHHKLIFERFLNPARISPPDIDVDCEKDRREELTNYLRTLYGENKVASVSTFLKMEDKGVIRDVSRIFEVPLFEVNKFSKVIIDGLDDALEKPEGLRFAQKYPQVIKHALRLRSQPKSYGRHAGGIILSKYDLNSGKNAHLVNRNKTISVNFDKNDSEYCGLLKFDYLGLSTWSVISGALKLIKKNHNKNINLYKINLEDEKVFKNISNGQTIGLFQISTWVLTNLIKQSKINNIDQLSDLLAICRPGPFDSGITDKYIKRKNGEKWKKKHHMYEEITKDTYGVVIYQEQIMFIFNKIAGLSMGVADEIRKVISKKRNEEEFEPYKIQFIDGCNNLGYFSEKEALDFWEELKAHARYSFNRSHSISYAFITYFTAWLKQYYPYEFICAALTYGSEGQKINLVKEAGRMKLEIVLPRIGKSDVRKWTCRNKKLYIPFIEVKGIGKKTLDKIKNIKLKKGFFSNEEKIKGKLKTILKDIGAYTGEVTEDVDKYFDLGIVFNPKIKYPKLAALVGDIDDYNVDDLINCNFKDRNFAKENNIKVHFKNYIACNSCSLRDIRDYETHPIKPVVGKYNIGILNGSPDWKNKTDYRFFDNHQIKKLNHELDKYGFDLEDFYISSIVKCKSKRVQSKEEIETCSKKWLTKEQSNVRMPIVLSFDNIAIQTFIGEPTGIMKYNGTTVWNEEYGFWVCYCVNPRLAIWKPEDFGKPFRKGIKNFITTLERIGGFE